MKKIISLTFAAAMASALILSPECKLTARAEEFSAGKAVYLMDAATGTAVYRREETKHLPIASMCKIMTLLLSFEAIDAGELSYDEMITVGEHASGMGGSQVFLDTGLSYSARSLMMTVAVCSANDSSVALAERIAGSESAFVARMNERAKELGAENTLFSNCTGLPKEPQYSCAKDVALMLRALITHETYFELCKVRVEDFVHPDGRTTQITNTNKLLRSYAGCDGGKTGFTSEAGFCLAATAKQGDTRLISVIIGADSSEERFNGTKALFDYAFGAYETRIVLDEDILEEKIPVRGSREKEIAVRPEHRLTSFGKRGTHADCTVEIRLENDLRAPVAEGNKVGEALLYENGVEIGRTDLLAAESATSMRWWDALRETAQHWQ